jgi:hypothetical protein
MVTPLDRSDVRTPPAGRNEPGSESSGSHERGKDADFRRTGKAPSGLV